MTRRLLASLTAVSLAATAACTIQRIEPAGQGGHDMAGMDSPSMLANGAAADVARMQDDPSIVAGAPTVADRLTKSPRHGEYIMLHVSPTDSVRAWVVYPQRKDKAAVVVVIHEIYGESTWIRGVADQLAADGFIGIEVNLLTGKVPAEQLDHDTVTVSVAPRYVQMLKDPFIQAAVVAAANWGMSQPSALKEFGTVGFCWGGGKSFDMSFVAPEGLKASVVYYGAPGASDDYKHGNIPVLAFYGGTDPRTTATAPKMDSIFKSLHKSYTYQVFETADHGFLRAQNKPANFEAAKVAWPKTVAFLHHYLGK